MMRNAVAQQSCRYLTPLLSRAGEKTHSFPASVFINSGFSIKAQGGRYLAQYTNISSFHKTLGFNYLCVSGTRGGGENGTTRLSRADVDLRNNLLSLPASERIPSWSELSYNPKCVCSLGSTDLETQQSLSVWKTTLKGRFNSKVNSWLRDRVTFFGATEQFLYTYYYHYFVLLNTVIAPVLHLLCITLCLYLKIN